MPILTPPNPVVAFVTADPLHKVTAVGNAGPTDAGYMTAWWEVELVSGSTELVVMVDRVNGVLFQTNRNWTDTFTVPLGLSFDGKRIRFVLQAESEALSVWRSAWVAMAGDNFDNVPDPSLAAPGTPAGVTAAVAATVQQRAASASAVASARRRVVKVPNESRYKLSKVHQDVDADAGDVVFGPLAKLVDFHALGTAARQYRMAQQDVGFMDKLAVQFFGPGREEFWWVLAYANMVIDPETDLDAGSVLQIPDVSLLSSFLARTPPLVAQR